MNIDKDNYFENDKKTEFEKEKENNQHIFIIGSNLIPNNKPKMNAFVK